MLEALVEGERNPQVPAEMALGRMRKKVPPLQEALVGRFGAHHALLVRTILARVDFLDTRGRPKHGTARSPIALSDRRDGSAWCLGSEMTHLTDRSCSRTLAGLA